MKSEMKAEQFCGVNLFTYEDYEQIVDDGIYFRNVQFCLDSMKKYDSMDVYRKIDGTFEIYGDNGKTDAWAGYVIDIDKIAEKISQFRRQRRECL